jgi:hypothetical protein
VVKLLLESKDVDVNSTEESLNGGTMNVLRRHMASKWEEGVSLLLAAPGVKLEATDEVGSTPLTRAVTDNWIPGVKMLLGAGARADHVTRMQYKPVAAFCKSAEVLQLLLDAGAKLNAPDGSSRPAEAEDGEWVAPTDGYFHPPLYSAAALNRPEVARAMVEAGADVNVRLHDGDSVLHGAINKCPDLVGYLLEKGAPAMVANDAGVSALVLGAQVAYPRFEVTPIPAELAKQHRAAFTLLVDRMLMIEKVHPFAPMRREFGGPLCIAAQISRAAPDALDALFHRFVLRKGSWNDVRYCRVNLAAQQEGLYEWTVSPEGLRSVEALLENPGSPALLEHLVCRALLTTLWDKVGRREIVMRLVLHSVLLLAYSGLMIALGNEDAATALAYVVLAATGLRIIAELRDLTAVPSAYIRDPWNALDWLAISGTVATALSVVLSPAEWPEAIAAVASVTALFWWFQLTEYIGSFERTAPVVRVFWASARALTSLMVVLVTLMLAFATAFKALHGPAGHFGALSVDVLSVVTMGDASITSVTGMELAVSIALIFVGAIVFVNVVIATLTNEYHRVMMDTQRAFLVERAANLGKVLRVTVSSSTWAGVGPRAEGLGQRLLFPRDRGIKGIIGASSLLFRYPTQPHALGLLYFSELAADSDRSTSRTWAIK